MQKIVTTSIVSLLLISTGSIAQSQQQQLDSRFRAASAILDAQLTLESVPGAAFGVVHDQSLVWSYNHGVESYKTESPVTNDTLFSICSVSKLFNGIAAMNLVEEGKLSLDAPIYDYIEGAAPNDNTGAEESATLRNILSHTSGLPREGIDDFWANYSFPDDPSLLASSRQHEQLYQPYEHWQYSNLGMALIGKAIAETSGVQWGEYIDSAILSPLGMEKTTTDMPFDRVGKGFARGYFVRNSSGQRNPVDKHQFRSYSAAAGIASSVNDMGKFASWNFRLRETGGEEILKATTLKNMQRIHWIGPDFEPPGWGLAFATRRFGKKTLWGHGGYCPGARTAFSMRLPDKTAYIMMATANDISPGNYVKMMFDFVNAAVTKVYGADEGTKSESANEVASGDVDLSEYEGHYAVTNYDWDSYIGLGDGELFSIALYGDNVVSNMQTFVHDKGDIFYRKRDDGSRGEPVIFERNADGKVSAVVQHSYRSLKQ